MLENLMMSHIWGWSFADQHDGATRHMDAQTKTETGSWGFAAHRQGDLIWFEHHTRRRRILNSSCRNTS